MIRRTYKAQPYDGDATLFRAEPYAWAHPESREGWKELIKGKLEIRPISGRHYEIVHQPHVQSLAAELKDVLKHAQSTTAESTNVLVE
jgi:thioesterase domain-containing protein